jgi:exopolysaccharide biosynthesis polyprenyl glycosylphosphotransferase
MFRRFSVNFAVFSMILDSGIIVGSLALAVYIRPILNDVLFIKIVGEGFVFPWEIYPIFAIIWVGVFLGISIYDGRRNFRVIEELSSLTWGVLLAAVASAGVLYLSYRDISRFMFISFVIFAGLSVGSWRMLYRWRIKNRPDQRTKRRVVIAGNGEVGQLVKKHLEENPMFGLRFVGFIGKAIHEDVLGGYHLVRSITKEEAIDDIIIALPRKDSHLVSEIVANLIDIPIRIWVVPDSFSLALHKAGIEEYAGITMLDLRASALNDYQRMTKRIFDLLGALLLLPLMIPIMILVSILIFLFDRGPIIFRQTRAGENGIPFTMYKFRTMVVGADGLRKTSQDENHKSEDDPRVTSLGKILRKTSLDELPQLFNVIKGEMSFVGPRPELLDLVDMYEPWQRARFAVPPGITGWWQVSGRSDKPMHLHTEDDLYYLNNYSLWLDLQIVVRTVWVVLIGKGAY